MSRNALDGKIVNLRQGLAIYKIQASPYWRCRIWLPSKKKRIVKTTKATTRAEAITVAEELFSAMGSKGTLDATPKEKTFQHFADRLHSIEISKGRTGEIFERQHINTQNLLHNKDYGAVVYFRKKPINEISTREYNGYIAWVRQQKPDLSVGTINHIAVAFRKVMVTAYNEGAIQSVPETPRQKHRDNPRAFFDFHPLVPKKDDEYELLKSTAQKMAKEKVSVRGAAITDELYDFIIFMVHSFLRPVGSEVYALRHRDVAVSEPPNPKGLILTVVDGKTGFRRVHTMPAAVSVYHRIKRRYEAHLANDHLFLPQYANRTHAMRIIQNQFNAVLDRAGLKNTDDGSNKHTVYSLRHTAICMRLVLGEVDVFWLAKNSGTSVDQIERFYARNLPPSADVVRQLQSFRK